VTKLADLTADDRLLVISGTEREYRLYLDEITWRQLDIKAGNIRRLRYLSDLRGWQGPHLYYVRIGTWDHQPYENGMLQLLRKQGAQQLDTA
jgi:hypothetical protein